MAGAGSGVGWLAVGPAAVREAVMAAVEKGGAWVAMVATAAVTAVVVKGVAMVVVLAVDTVAEGTVAAMVVAGTAEEVVVA